MNRTESLRALVRGLRLGKAEEETLVPLGHNWVGDEDLAPLLSSFRHDHETLGMEGPEDFEEEMDSYDSDE